MHNIQTTTFMNYFDGVVGMMALASQFHSTAVAFWLDFVTILLCDAKPSHRQGV